MTDLKVGYLTRQAIYQGVHLRGQGAWDGNAALRLPASVVPEFQRPCRLRV